MLKVVIWQQKYKISHEKTVLLLSKLRLFSSIGDEKKYV